MFSHTSSSSLLFFSKVSCRMLAESLDVFDWRKNTGACLHTVLDKVSAMRRSYIMLLMTACDLLCFFLLVCLIFVSLPQPHTQPRRLYVLPHSALPLVYGPAETRARGRTLSGLYTSLIAVPGPYPESQTQKGISHCESYFHGIEAETWQ